MKSRLFFLFFCVIHLGFSQTSSTLPQDYFKSPLNIPLYLAGNFGELRSNHFHSGLDLKTRQRTGLEVKASAQGYVSRVKKALYGYGNVIYIKHPNGYTTVYGHLKEFAPKIRKYVRQQQYKQEKNNIELFPNKTDLPVAQGEVIALSGQSGGAAGPHVHFEIRNEMEHPMNPLSFGFHIKDHRAPSIYGLYVYPTGGNSAVNRSAKRQKLSLYKQKDGSYKSEKITAYGKLGFGIDALDHMDGSHNTDGLYQIQTSLNGAPRFELTFDRFSFTNSRYINRYIDYGYYKKHKKRIQKLFVQPNNKVDAQRQSTDKGYIQLKAGFDYKYKIVLKDYAGNKTIIRVPITAEKTPQTDIVEAKPDSTAYFAHTKKSTVFDLQYHDIYIPKGALYEDTYLDIEDQPGKVKVHHYTTPLHKKITIGFDASPYSQKDREKLYVARITPWGAKYYSDTYKDKTRITTKTRTFGTYTLASDTTPPTIKPVNFHQDQWKSNAAFLKLKIKDHQSGISAYRGTINGKFIVLEYDYKSGIIKYDFSDQVADQTENKLKVIVTDKVGNSSTYKATFYRKER